MKKIIVAGCANCPYLQLWNDGTGKGIESLSTAQCKHPVWNRELLHPSFDSDWILIREVKLVDGKAVNGDIQDINATYTPKWCPLPENN